MRGEDGLVEKDTKTHRALRIALDDSTVELLREHQVRCEKRARECGTELEVEAFVFSYAPDGSTPWPPLSLAQRFSSPPNRLGLDDVRLHDLRHYVATRSSQSACPSARCPAASGTRTRRRRSA